MRRLFQRYMYWLLFTASLTGSWGCANLTATLPSPPGFLTPINLNGPYDADIPLRDARRIKNASLMQDQAVPYLFLRVADHFQTADDAPRSLHFFNRALQEFRKRGNAPGEGMALNRKLSALVHFGRLEEVFQELEERGRMHSADPLRAFINYGYGYYHLKAGHYAEAQKLFAQVITAGPLETDNGEWLALQRDAALGIGLVVVLGEYFPFLADQLSTLDFNYDLFQTIRQSMAAAATHLEEVVALNRRIRATDVYRYYPEVVSPFADCDTANLLGLAYGAAGKTAQAVKQLDQAARLAKKMNYPLGKADHRFIFDQIYLINEKRIPDIRDVQALSDLAERYQWVSYSIWAKLMKAHEYRQAGDINQTIEIVDGALALLEDNAPWLSREEGFRGILLFRRRVLYETLIGLHVLRNNQEGAFQTAERMKGAFLAEHAAEELTAKTDELREPLMQLREQRRQLAANYRRLVTPAKELDVMAAVEKSRTARKACGDLIAEIRIKDEALHTLIDPARPRTKEVQRLLDANTTLFAYYAGEKSLYIWVISKNAVRQEIVKVSRSEVDHLVTSWIDAMKRRDRDVADRLAEKVYDLFLKPVIPFVYGDRIGFVPDISLYHMPFAAMRYVGSYLADGFSLFQIPCVSLLKSLLADASPLDAKKAIFVEDAACLEKRQAVKPAALETNVLKRVLPYSPTVVLNARAGNRMADISGNYGIISAVLAEAFSVQPSSSPGRTPASLPCFRAGDLVRLKISGQLTLLSVCHPRRSWTVEKGITASLVEWLCGVSPRIILQLWDVDEKARKVFWPLFYDALKKRGSVADALRDAQGGMIQNGYGPFDWAAFVLTGRY